MADRSAKSGYRSLAVSILASAAMLVAASHLVDGISLQKTILRLSSSLGRLMALIGIGLAVGQIIEATGWTRTLSVLSQPLFSFGNLGNRCSAAFTAAFFSGTASNAMLSGFYRDGKITRGELFLTNLVNQFPAYFLHLPTTFFIIIPLTGRAGLLYFLMTFSAAVLRTMMFLVYGHFRFPAKGSDEEQTGEEQGRTGRHRGKNLLHRIRERLPQRLAGIAAWVIPIYILVYLLQARGFFELLRKGLALFVTDTVLPVESLSVVVLGFTAEFTSGFAAAGALMDAGVLTVKQTALALVIGNIIAFPIRALRHQLPRYVGIFTPGLGTQLLLAGQGFRVISLIMAATVYYLLG